MVSRQTNPSCYCANTLALAPMSLVSHIFANPQFLKDSFLAWWWAGAGPVVSLTLSTHLVVSSYFQFRPQVAGIIVANRGIEKRAEKHLERRAAYGEAESPFDDSEVSSITPP